MQRAMRVTRALLAAIRVVGMLCFASGCRASDAMKEIVYEQTAKTVDYDNPNKYYINDPTADEKSDLHRV